MQETPKSSIWLRFTAEPRTGRFITRDSYRGERENADTWHLYAYCANNPINYVDPSGHQRQNHTNRYLRTGTKLWYCLKTTKRALRETIAPYYKYDTTKNLFNRWILDQMASGLISSIFEEQKLSLNALLAKLKKRKVIKTLKLVNPLVTLTQTAYDIGSIVWKGNMHKIWKKIDKFYKKHLIGRKAKESKTVYFCKLLSYKRKGQDAAFLPTGTVEVHLKKHTHSK